MPFNGSGTFVSLAPPNFPAVPGTVILASQFNNNMNDIFTSGLTNCMTRDGQSPPSNNIPMAGFKLTGLGNGTADTDAAALGQTLGLRGQVGTVDWNTRILTGMFEATAASLGGGSSNFPPTSDLGMLNVEAQGAIISQMYYTAWDTWIRQKLAGTWSSWIQVRQGVNRIVNGAFQAWQRGTSLGGPNTGTKYMADMVANQSVGSTYQVAQGPFAAGNTATNSDAQYFHEIAVQSVAGAGNYCATGFGIESVRSFAGQQITVSFWAKADAARPIGVDISQIFGLGGSPSASVSTFVFKPTLTTGWVRYQGTITMPSLSGKTIGTTPGTDYLALNVWWDAGSTFNARTGTLGQQSGTFDLWGMKIEAGPTATPFIIPDFSTNMNQCERYFCSGSGFYAGVGYSAFVEGTPLVFPVAMAFLPTIALGVNSSSNVSSFTAQLISTTGFSAQVIPTAAGPAAWSENFNWSAAASLI